MVQNIYNPAEWTEQDRQLIDAARQLNPEEMDFMLDLMQMVNDNPARVTAAERLADQYSLRTAEGRTSFLEALQAV